MKSKAKPVKGSARVQKFDRGGTIGALAGLGTLAYLMRDKFGKGKDKTGAGDANLGSGETTAKPKMKGFDPEKAAEIAQISGGNVENEPGKGGRAGIITPEPGRDLSLKGETDEQRKANIFGKYKPQERVVTAPQSTEAAEPIKPVSKAKVAAKPVAKTAAKPVAKAAAKASDKVGKGYEKLDTRDTGYSGVTKQAGSQSFGGAATKPTAGTESKKYPSTVTPSSDRPTKPIPKAPVPHKFNAEEEMNATLRRRKAAETERTAKEAAAKAKKDKETKNSGSGFGPKTTITKEKSDAAKKSYYSGFKKPLFERGNLGIGKKTGGSVKKYAAGGSVSSASKRADGIAQRGKTRA